MNLSELPALLRSQGIQAATIYRSGEIHFVETHGVFVCKDVADFEKAVGDILERRALESGGQS